MDNSVKTMGDVCKCTHHKATPIIVILFGLLFLLGEFDIFSPDIVGMVWPILVIIGGALKMGERNCTCC